MTAARVVLAGLLVAGAAAMTPVGRRVLRAVAPESLAATADRAAAEARDIAETVREGMTEREAELRLALGLDTPALPPGARLDPEKVRELLRDPAGWRARQG